MSRTRPARVAARLLRTLVCITALVSGCDDGSSEQTDTSPADTSSQQDGADLTNDLRDVGDTSTSDGADIADATDTREPPPPCEAGPWTATSPDGTITVDIAPRIPDAPDVYPDIEALYYRATGDGHEIVEWSPLGIETEALSWHEGLCLDGEPTTTDIDTTYTMPVGKRLERAYVGRELVLPLANPTGDPIELVFRVHDDGFAYRYHLDTGGEAQRVNRELSGFRIPASAQGWMAQYDIDGLFLGGSYEHKYRAVDVGEKAPDGSSWAFPTLFRIDPTDETAPWMLLTESDLDGSYAGTRFEGQPEDRVYRIRFPERAEGNSVGARNPTAPDPTTPWRVAIVGSLDEVVESTLVDDLARPSTVQDESWIAPGRVAWSWFSQDTGDPDLQRAYIDFAARLGWEYVLIDARWDQWTDAEATVQTLVDEAADKGVELLLWYNSGGPHQFNTMATPLDRMHIDDVRRAELDKIAAWGIAGIKVDFFNSDKQDRIQQYLAILGDAAERELLVNFHGATLPRGWQRTYPHLMTHEAVRGQEFYKFIDPPGPIDHVRYALVRNVVGSMDYTPGAIDVPFEDGGQPYGHAVALPVLFESGLQHFSGRADGAPEAGYARLFTRFPFAESFFADMPAVWNETRLLEGHPDTHVVLARRSGTEWWIAGISADPATAAPRQLSLSLDFLDAMASARCLETGATPDSLTESITDVGPGDPLTMSVAPGDGFVCVLR